MGLFGGEDLPEQWVFADVTVHLDGREFASVERITVRHTVDRRRDMTLGALGLALRSIEASTHTPARSSARVMREDAAAGVGNVVDATCTGVEGFLISVHGVRVGIPHDMRPSHVVDAVATHVSAMVTVLCTLPGPGWHRYDEEHFKHFFRCVPDAELLGTAAG